MTIYALDLIDELRNGYLEDHGGDISTTTGYLYKWQDKNSPPLRWSNEQVVRYINWAIMEIGKRNPIYDSGTTTNVAIPILANKADYTYDSHIMSIEEIKLSSSGRPLTKITRESKEYEVLPHPDYFTEVDWDSETGDVTHYIEDMANRCIRLYKMPTVADTMLLTVTRRYNDLLDWGDLSTETTAHTRLTEIPDELREALLLGAASRAFLRRDEETYDPQIAKMYEADFDKFVGEPVDWRTLENRRRNANKSVQITPFNYTPKIHRGRTYYGQTTADQD